MVFSQHYSGFDSSSVALKHAAIVPNIVVYSEDMLSEGKLAVEGYKDTSSESRSSH